MVNFRKMLRPAGLLLVIIFINGCASIATTGQTYNAEKVFAVQPALDLTSASQLAEDVFQQQKVAVTGSSIPSGYISGITYRGSGINRISFFLDVYLGIPQPGTVNVKATSTAGPEVAFTTDLDDIAEDFMSAYEQALPR